MNPILQVLYAHPLQTIGTVFTIFAMAAVLLFLRGFSSGFGNFFTFDHNEYYLEKAHVRVTWGVLMLYAIFTVWEILRYVVGWIFETPTMSAGGFEFLAFMWILYFVMYQFAFKHAK